MPTKNKSFIFTCFLLLSLGGGALLGYFNKPLALMLKPLGDIFLNLIFTIIVPLIFFSIASAVTHLGQHHQMEKLALRMILTFILMSFIAAVYMLIVVVLFHPAEGITLATKFIPPSEPMMWSDQFVKIISVPEFIQLFSHHNMLPLIFFAILVGVATCKLGVKGDSFARFLDTGTHVFMKVSTYVMYYAPIGFFAYFAVLVAELGPQLLGQYFRVSIIYYSAALVYFILGFSFITAIAGGGANRVKQLWRHVSTPAITALATCSSAASIPANLAAVKNMGVPADVYETVVPLGGILHKDGSVLGAMVKIAFLFGIFHMSFTGMHVFVTAIAISMLVGTAMGAIPSGGMLGEMLILSMYGFPAQALIIIAAISIIIDPLATMLNVTGNTVASLVVGNKLADKC